MDEQTPRFTDRRAAGVALARSLARLAADAPIVFGLARGGVPVAYEVARRLGGSLDVLVARKVGAPRDPELAIGAVAEGGVRVLNDELIDDLGVSPEEVEAALLRAEGELETRLVRYRGGRPLAAVEGRVAVVVDDGLATGATALAGLRAIRAGGPRRLVLAAPVGAAPTVAALSVAADDVVCLRQPDPLGSVSAWYEHFGQVSDADVRRLCLAAPDAGRR